LNDNTYIDGWDVKYLPTFIRDSRVCKNCKVCQTDNITVTNWQACRYVVGSIQSLVEATIGISVVVFTQSITVAEVIKMHKNYGFVSME